MKLSLFCLLSMATLTIALRRTKFQHWYPQYAHHWIRAVEGRCQQEVVDYRTNNRTECRSPCACAADCILESMTGTIQANFASAQVLLGLVPVTLSFIGPTVSEVAVLSTYRPLLAFLVAVGSPAVNITRVFRSADVLEPFIRPLSAFSKVWSNWLARQPCYLQILFRASAYLIVLAAIYNNVRASVDTDMRTISGWRCAALHMPLAWSTLAGIIHGWGMLAIRIRLGNWRIRPLKSILESDIFMPIRATKDSVLSEACFWMASVCATIHMIYGILVLSSLVFISSQEAIQLFALYALSAVVCHFILLLEMASMRHALDMVDGCAADTRLERVS